MRLSERVQRLETATTGGPIPVDRMGLVLLGEIIREPSPLPGEAPHIIVFGAKDYGDE